MWFEQHLEARLLAAHRRCRRRRMTAISCGLVILAGAFAWSVIDRPRLPSQPQAGLSTDHATPQIAHSAALSGASIHDFRVGLAAAEGNAVKEGGGYRESNERSGALGRYQMTPIALQSVGMLDDKRRWTGRYGVSSPSRFLADRYVQERVLAEFLSETERQLIALGTFRYVGVVIVGKEGHFTITRSGLLAAGHRAGSVAVREYLLKIATNRFSSRELPLSPGELAIETRLRAFAECPAPRPGERRSLRL